MIELRRALLDGEGLDSDRILAGIAPAPAGDSVMQRFADICREYHSSNATASA